MTRFGGECKSWGHKFLLEYRLDEIEGGKRKEGGKATCHQRDKMASINSKRWDDRHQSNVLVLSQELAKV